MLNERTNIFGIKLDLRVEVFRKNVGIERVSGGMIDAVENIYRVRMMPGVNGGRVEK